MGKLTDLEVKQAKFSEGGEKNKRRDGDGLYLHLTPAGGKLWQMKYRFGTKEKLHCDIWIPVAKTKSA